jgi:NADPH:quinone reductase-like Zn-dependent oxidoreductase
VTNSTEVEKGWATTVPDELQDEKSGAIPYPGHTSDMADKPRDEMRDYVGRGLLQDKRALVTGGDSGIGRAVSVALAKEDADVAIGYLEEHDDATPHPTPD